MKASILLIALLFSTGLHADHTADHKPADHEKHKTHHQHHKHHKHLSHRPHAVAPVKPNSVNPVEETESEKHYKTLQLHNLGRRPHAEK